MYEGAKDSVPIVVLCCAMFKFKIITMGCIRIVHSYSMVMHIELLVQVHIGAEARRSNGESFSAVLCTF